MKQEIIAGNILISEFMGPSYESTFTGKGRLRLYVGRHGIPNCEAHELDFHEDWRALMPVIEKISSFKYPDGELNTDYAYPRTFGMLSEEGEPMFRFNRQQLCIASTLIKAAWEAAVEFIQWYNATFVLQSNNEEGKGE